MELMEINEQIEEGDEKVRRSLQGDLKQKMEELIEEISVSFTQNDLETAKTLVIKLKYFTNIDDKLREILPPLS